MSKRARFSVARTTYALILILLLVISSLGLTAYVGTASAPKIKVPSKAVPDNNTPQTLPFSQDWTNTGLITANDDWSGVLGIQGFLGDDAGAGTGVDPQTVVIDYTTIDVIANQTNPNITNGGVAEFDGIANPVVAFQGSGTADFPNIILYLNTTGQTGVNISYNLRDIDATTDNAVQSVALQYRIGNTGNFTNVPAGFVAMQQPAPA